MVGLLIWFLVARHFHMDGPNSALASVVLCGAAMAAWSIGVDKVHRRASTGIDWGMVRRTGREATDISLVKLTGLLATWGIIALAYGTLRYYWQGNYSFAMSVFTYTVIPLVIIAVPYVLWIDRRLVDPKDGAWHFGQWLLGGEGAEADKIWRHWRAWVVKGFFLAFMLSVVPGNYDWLVAQNSESVLADPASTINYAINFLYMIDVHFATVGYVLTMRPLDAHIRTANPYGMGWVAALICYPPFVLMGGGGPLDYHVGTADWNVWMQVVPALVWAWGALLVLLTAIYAWATVAFGPRFSNLTHRGIITHGPYAFSRHPAYLAKNTFWWLSSLVILPWDGGITTALRNTVLLAIVSGVYYWRAKTEEKHLLGDPEYRAYYEWAQEHALIPRLCSRLTGLKRAMIDLHHDGPSGPTNARVGFDISHDGSPANGENR